MSESPPASLAAAASAVVRSNITPRVALITLQRPERLNAVSLPLYEALLDVLRGLEEDETVRAAVLTGAGRAFCAGADLKAHNESRLGAEARAHYAKTAQRANRALRRGRVPVVAAVNGAAVGAGLELALSCDFMVVASAAKLRLPELALGTFVGGGVTRELPRRIGVARARELLLLGEFFDGERAHALGLAHKALPGDEVLPAALQLAEQLAALAPVPLAHMRRLLERVDRWSLRRTMAEEARALEACMATDDWQEGVRAFAEKRVPRYSGR